MSPSPSLPEAAANAGCTADAVLHPPPLSLYVHLPWCVRKCPYCDFNSHEGRGPLPFDAYVDALLADLDHDLPLAWGRTIQTVFFGGGTPSLFPPEAIDRFLQGASSRLRFAPACEVTLETNPGTAEHGRFELQTGSLPTWSHPVVANGKLFLRDQDVIYAYNVRAN